MGETIKKSRKDAVMPALVIPHVTTGRVLWSPVVRTVFNSDPLADLEQDNVIGFFKKEAVSHVRFQIFPSPAYRPSVTSLSQFETVLDQLLNPRVAWCKKHGMRAVGLADETFMFQRAREWMWNSPLAADAVRMTAAKVRQAGIIDCIEMVDESKSPSIYQADNFVKWWREGNGPGIAWPTVSHGPWEVANLAAYASRYASFWRAGALPFKDQADFQRSIGTGGRRDWPFMALIWGCEPQIKGGRVFNGGVQAQHILAQIVLALIYGASGINVYGYDCARWRLARVNPGPDDLLQTGFKPGSPLWSGVAVGFRLIQMYEAEMGKDVYEPTLYGNFILGRRGNLVLCLNLSNQARPDPRGPRHDLIEPRGVRVWKV